MRLTIGRGFQSWDACWAESWVPWYTLFLSKYTTFQEMMGRLVTNFSQSFQLIPSLQGLGLKKMVWVWETWPLLRMVCVNLLARDLRWVWLKRHLNCNYLMSCCCVFNVTASDSEKKIILAFVIVYSYSASWLCIGLMKLIEPLHAKSTFQWFLKWNHGTRCSDLVTLQWIFNYDIYHPLKDVYN